MMSLHAKCRSYKMPDSEVQQMACTLLWQTQMLTSVLLFTCGITTVIGSSAILLIRNAATLLFPLQLSKMMASCATISSLDQCCKMSVVQKCTLAAYGSTRKCATGWQMSNAGCPKSPQKNFSLD